MWRSSISAYLSLIAAVLGLCNAPVSLAQAATRARRHVHRSDTSSYGYEGAG